MITVGSLFSGIGGLELGLERAGMQVKWQVENDDYCRRVLTKHWPGVPKFGDITAIDAAELEPVDLICGGWPCQPFSIAGKRLGTADERNMWPEFLRIICALRPRWIVGENVPAVLTTDVGRYFGDILRTLSESGYDTEWDCIPAAVIGAPHLRDRLWLVAYASEFGYRQPKETIRAGRDAFESRSQALPDTNGASWDSPRGTSEKVFRPETEQRSGRCSGLFGRRWTAEPNVGRVAYGVPARVDRLKALGNAVVPQVSEWIGRRIVEYETGAA